MRPAAVLALAILLTPSACAGDTVAPFAIHGDAELAGHPHLAGGNGTPDDPFVLADLVVDFGSGRAESGAAVALAGTRAHVALRNLSVVNRTAESVGYLGLSDAENVTVEGFRGPGVVVSRCSDRIVVRNGTLRGGGFGVYWTEPPLGAEGAGCPRGGIVVQDNLIEARQFGVQLLALASAAVATNEIRAPVGILLSNVTGATVAGNRILAPAAGERQDAALRLANVRLAFVQANVVRDADAGIVLADVRQTDVAANELVEVGDAFTVEGASEGVTLRLNRVENATRGIVYERPELAAANPATDSAFLSVVRPVWFEEVQPPLLVNATSRPRESVVVPVGGAVVLALEVGPVRNGTLVVTARSPSGRAFEALLVDGRGLSLFGDRALVDEGTALAEALLFYPDATEARWSGPASDARGRFLVVDNGRNFLYRGGALTVAYEAELTVPGPPGDGRSIPGPGALIVLAFAATGLALRRGRCRYK